MATDKPTSFASLTAFSFCSIVVCVLTESKIAWQPDSAPKLTSWQSASLIFTRTSLEIRSTLVWQSQGTPMFLFLISSQIVIALLDELEERLQRRIDEIDTGGYPVPVGASTTRFGSL